MHPLHNSIIEFYDNRASSYDSEPSGFHPRLAKDLVKWAEPAIPDALKSPTRVLDLCCGTGLASMAAYDLFGPESIVHGVDISKKSLEIAKKKAEKVPNVTFYEGSAIELDTLPLEKSSYSLIMCCSALVLLPQDLETTLRQWTTYLQPGGIIIFDVPAEDTQMVSLLMSDSVEPYGVPTIPRRWVTKDSVPHLIVKSGLDTKDMFLTENYATKEYKIEDFEDAWDRGAKVPICGVERLGVAQREAAKRTFLEEMKARTDEHGVMRDTWSLYIAIAQKSVT